MWNRTTKSSAFAAAAAAFIKLRSSTTDMDPDLDGPDQSYRPRDTFAIILQGTCTLYSIVDASCFWIFNVAAAAAAVVDFFGQRMAGFALFFAAGKYLSCLMWDRTIKRLREQWSRDNVNGGL